MESNMPSRMSPIVGPAPIGPSIAVAALLSLVGCTGPSDRFYVVDNFSNQLISSTDQIADVYAVGSELRFDVGHNPTLFGKVDMSGWTLISSDPAVVELAEVHTTDDSISVDGMAEQPGTTQLQVVDEEGDIVHEVSLEVDLPDSVALVSKLGTDIGSGFEPTNPQKVCVGAYSAFEARFSASGRSVSSAHVLSAEGSDTVSVQVEDSSLWESREWLSVWPTLGGPEVVEVYASGTLVEEVLFSAVEPSEIVGIQIVGNAAAVGADRGDTLLVGAVGLDAAGSMVLGVTPTWFMPDGTEMVGDELSFTADARVTEVTVRYGAVSTTVTVSGSPTGTQDSADISCATARAAPARWLLLFGLFCVALRRSEHGQRR